MKTYKDFSNVQKYIVYCNENLLHADLICADLSNADLRGADLRGADLSNVNLIGTDLGGADLRGADLSDANLMGANLRCASLIDTNLRDAYLIDASLIGANLSGADLSGANLSGVQANHTTTGYWPVCPTSGAFVAFKSILSCDEMYIVKLLIPEDAKRSSATTRKCRASYAHVLNVENVTTGESYNGVLNTNILGTYYKVGSNVYPDKYDEDRWNECSNGIHFFITREEAIQWGK